MSEEATVDQIRERHQCSKTGGRIGLSCVQCGQLWPCHTDTVLREVERLRAAALPVDPPSRLDEIANAMTGLGNAYRGDWADFDGRTLRDQMDALASVVVSDSPFDSARWLIAQGVCPVQRSWFEHCDVRSEGVSRHWCDHAELAAAVAAPTAPPDVEWEVFTAGDGERAIRQKEPAPTAPAPADPEPFGPQEDDVEYDIVFDLPRTGYVIAPEPMTTQLEDGTRARLEATSPPRVWAFSVFTSYRLVPLPESEK